MIIKSYEVNKINPEIHNLLLFYGKNEGLKNHITKNIIKNEIFTLILLLIKLINNLLYRIKISYLRILHLIICNYLIFFCYFFLNAFLIILNYLIVQE